jgi:predicted ferric reductase
MIFLVPLGLWLLTTGNPLFYFLEDTPPGQGLYVISKGFALLALSLFWFQCVAALTKSTPNIAGFFRLSPRAHKLIGSTLLALILAHVFLFFYAVSLRSGHFAFGVLIPSFSHGFYKFYVSLGVIALALLIVGLVAGILRSKYLNVFTRWGHRLWFVAFGLIFLHGVNIGTETRLGIMLYVYYFILVSIVFLVANNAVYGLRCKLAERAQRNANVFTDG